MFGHNRNEQLPYDYSSEFPCHFPLPESTVGQTYAPLPLFLPPLAIPGAEQDTVSALRSEVGGYTSSGCSSYGGSPTSCYGTSYSPTATLMQRSLSSHSLHRNLTDQVYSPNMHLSPPATYFECESSNSVRKVLSTGDLQQGVNLAQRNQRANSPLANECSIIESMNRASPYSPEEKKERIERYRSKRNLRNFNKKIKYECRKTLADSRPRIRGRFARNDEIEKTPDESQWDHHAGVEEDEEDNINIDDNWISILDAFSANLMP